MKKILLAFAAGFLLSLLIMDSASAIPAFARRYKLSCSTCHAPFPKLKAYGNDYAGSGFILQENEKERDYVTAGDDLLWLNKDFPMAVRFDAFAVYESDDAVKSDLQTPYGLKFLSGGALYKNIGYYFYFFMSETGEVAGIEDAYIHLNNIFGTHLDVMIGQFQTCDPLMKRELRLTFEDYWIYKIRPGRSYNNLTYDRGIMLSYDIAKTGTNIVGMIVNGNGKPEAQNSKMDRDQYKNYGIRILQSVTDAATIGGFYYYGKEAEYFSGGKAFNEITYYGPDVTIDAGSFGFTGQYLIRQDSNPVYYNLANDIQTSGIVAELVYSPRMDRSRWYLTALYNNITSDLDDLNLQDLDVDPLAYETATLSATFLLSRNFRIVGELTRDLGRNANRFVLGLNTAF